jgi:hypothetical protein
MKNFLLITVFLALVNSVKAQNTETLIAYDYVESFDWSGAWFFNNPTTGYFSDISVSPAASAVIYGTGNNSREEDWYSLPNVNVDNGKDHIFRMRLAAQTISSPTANTAGLDGGDYVDIQLSKNGGGFVSEMRIKGFANATWDYSSTATAGKISTGSLTTFQPSSGGDRNGTGDGYSYIELYIPSGPSQIAIDVYARATRAGEDWWMDNFELYEVTPSSLPVELSSFEAEPIDNYNFVTWTTESEYNSDYFMLESSFDGEVWTVINVQEAAGNSVSRINYSYIDDRFGEISYYRLVQYDIDGKSETFGAIYVVRNYQKKPIYKRLNLAGQEVDENYKGVIIVMYQDGTSDKFYNR